MIDELFRKDVERIGHGLFEALRLSQTLPAWTEETIEKRNQNRLHGSRLRVFVVCSVAAGKCWESA
jgi:hypothetical protein